MVRQKCSGIRRSYLENIILKNEVARLGGNTDFLGNVDVEGKA